MTIDLVGTQKALWIFARFPDGEDVGVAGGSMLPECPDCGPGWPSPTSSPCGDPPTWDSLPEWADSLLEDTDEPEIPGSLTHFFYTMSQGDHILKGTIVPEIVVSDTCITTFKSVGGGIGRANKHIIQKAVAEHSIDLSEYDLTGDDGEPDNVVDFVFVCWQSIATWDENDTTPSNRYKVMNTNAAVSSLDSGDFAIGGYTIKNQGGCWLGGIKAEFDTEDAGCNANSAYWIRHRWMIGAVAAHEYGHDLLWLAGMNTGNHITTESRYGLMTGSQLPPVWQLSGLMRMKAGWLDPPLIPFPTSFPYETSVTLSVDYEDDEGCFALVESHIDGAQGQYFLLEARKPGLPDREYNSVQPESEEDCCLRTIDGGDGLLITHVREGGSGCWGGTLVPPLLDIEVASGRFDSETGAPDPVVGSTLIDESSRTKCPHSLGPKTGRSADLFKPMAGGDSLFANAFTPFTNPNTALYVEFPNNPAFAQSVYSGISFYDIEWVPTADSIRVKIRIDDPADPPVDADTLRVDTTIDGLLQLTADLVVSEDVTLTLKPGSAVVAAAEQDRLSGGSDDELVELIGVGPVESEGESANPVRFTSSRADEFDASELCLLPPNTWPPDQGAPAPGDWFGFRMKSADLANQSSLIYTDLDFARVAVSVDSLSGNLFHPRFANSAIADIRFDRDVRIPEDYSWNVDAPLDIQIANSDASGWGDPDRIHWQINGFFESNSADPGTDWISIAPETPSTDDGNDWNGITVFDLGGMVLRDADIGYAATPIEFLGSVAPDNAVARCFVHHYSDEGVRDWASSVSILDSIIDKGSGLNENLGSIGVHLFSSAGTVSGNSISDHLLHGIRAEWSSSQCSPPSILNAGVLTITENQITGDDEPTELPEEEEDEDSGIFVTWVCDSLSAVVDQNLIEKWTRGLDVHLCSDTQITCNTIRDNLIGIRYTRGTAMPINAADGVVKLNQTHLDSNYLFGVEVPTGVGLRVGDTASPPDPGKNTFELDLGSSGTRAYFAVQVVDPEDSGSTLNAGRNTWYDTGGDVTQDANDIRSYLIEDFLGQVGVANPRQSDGLCNTMPAAFGTPGQAESADPAMNSPSTDGEDSGPLVFGLRLLRQGSPANGRVEMQLEVPRDKSGPVRVDIYDVTGRHVREVMRVVESGRFNISWDGLDNRGNRVRPGVLFVRAVTGDSSVTKKIVVGEVAR